MTNSATAHDPSPSDPLAKRAALFTQMQQISVAETVPLFRTGVDVDNKNAPGQGFDPVTEADRNCEQALRALIELHFPHDGIIGEEFGRVRDDADYLWIIDPIDGTRAFIAGVPLWGTLVGILHHGQPVATFACQPFIGEAFSAISKGPTPTANWSKAEEKRSLTTRPCTELATATLMTTTPDLFSAAELACYRKVEEQVRTIRYGTDWYGYALIASGTCDMIVESGLSSYDILPLVAMIEAAGGAVTDWRGEPLASGRTFTTGQVLAVGDASMLPPLIELMSPAAT
ncbi:MAG: histidinol-phosphatase [Hyphomicrobiales bacterium]